MFSIDICTWSLTANSPFPLRELLTCFLRCRDATEGHQAPGGFDFNSRSQTRGLDLKWDLLNSNTATVVVLLLLLLLKIKNALRGWEFTNQGINSGFPELSYKGKTKYLSISNLLKLRKEKFSSRYNKVQLKQYPPMFATKPLLLYLWWEERNLVFFWS